jgi:hypothetical protein
MSETPRIDPQTSVAAGALTPARRGSPTSSANPAFESLLERLTTRAAELGQRTGKVETPEQVGQAVDAARASLEDALTLGERLLEAYRQARQTGQEGR